MTQFININKCYSFQVIASTSAKALSAFTASEVLIINQSGGPLTIYDVNITDDGRAIQIEDTQSIVIRGLTNTESLSVKSATTGSVWCRSAYYSNLNQR